MTRNNTTVLINPVFKLFGSGVTPWFLFTLLFLYQDVMIHVSKDSGGGA